MNDQSHQHSDRQTRDRFVEHIFQVANLPLVRIPVKTSYSLLKLSKQLQPYFKITETLPPVLEETKPDEPRCPNAGMKWCSGWPKVDQKVGKTVLC